ncbi:T9SS type A sorting domain-containing protein [Candidatus Falkowbacteria bacterium]|nr:T9SS type A sorting domain-containing protein [Candidatus Falkowbacteria bacterium]
MKSLRLQLCTVLLLSLGLTGLQAQEVISATGGEASGGGGSVSYSVGQVFYTTSTGTTGSVAQGVQQPYEISVVTEIEQAKDINLMILAYPNPTNDYLMLKVDNYDNKNLLYQLFDISGKLLESKKITSNETQIKMEMLIPSNYFIKVTDKKKEIKTFKIIKN